MPLSARKPDAYVPERDHLEEQHPEPNTSFAVDETLDGEAPVEHWHELPCQVDSANPAFEQTEDLDASFHEQLAALVRALGEEPKSQHELSTAHAAADVTDRTEAPQLKAQVPEQKGWLPDWRPISLAALNEALDGRARGFVAGLGASIAVGAAALALAGGIEEPPPMASIEAQDSVQVVAEAQSEAPKVEAQSEAVQVRGSTDLPLRATLPDEITNAQIEPGKIGATEDGSGRKYAIAAIPGTMVVPTAEPQQAPELLSSNQQLTESAGAAPVTEEAKVEGSNSPQSEAPEEVALSFETTVEATSEEDSESMSSVEDSTSETEIAYAVKYANLRAGPTNSAAVLAIIPEGSPVEVIQCKAWCEVIAQGQRGWVYKDLIRDHNG